MFIQQYLNKLNVNYVTFYFYIIHKNDIFLNQTNYSLNYCKNKIKNYFQNSFKLCKISTFNFFFLNLVIFAQVSNNSIYHYALLWIDAA